MMQKIRNPRASLLCLFTQVGIFPLTLTMVGCQAGKDQSNTITSQAVDVATLSVSEPNVMQAPSVVGLSEPFVGSEKIMSDIKAAGFSVADPKQHWGVTIIVDAGQRTGGFVAELQEGVILLRWTKASNVTSYEIFRGINPIVPLMMETTLTMNAGGNSLGVDNQWPDNKVAPETRYYYVVLGITNDGNCSVVATGNAMTLASGQPPIGVKADGGQPGQADSEATDRRAIRQRDGVTSLDMGQHASSAPNGIYAFTWSYYGAGDFLVNAEHEPNPYDHPFEIHKLSDGRYSLVGYVDADTAKKIREDKSGFALTIYAHRWSAATEIVALPIERLSSYAHAVKVAIEGKQHYIMKVDWK